MKKIILSACISIAFFSSCRKEHTCTCVFNNPAVGQTPQITALTYKKDATNWCTAYQTNLNANGVTGWTCTVK
jgi:hypothetical protein